MEIICGLVLGPLFMKNAWLGATLTLIGGLLLGASIWPLIITYFVACFLGALVASWIVARLEERSF